MESTDSSVSKAVFRLQKTAEHILAEGIQVEETAAKPPAKLTFDPKTEALLKENGGHHQGKEKIKWNGWGYDDTAFKLNSDGHVYLTGKRYSLSGVAFPKLRPWAEQVLGLDLNHTNFANPNPPKIPPPQLPEAFLQEIKGEYVKLSSDDADRIMHCHGHTCEDIFKLRTTEFDKYPDMVIWPGKHEHVEKLVAAAQKHNVVIIPYGGGTSVSAAIEPVATEKRPIVSLDMHEMNRIKWIDYDSMVACIEAGVIGKDLDTKLAKLGLCMGHEPDSSEFSSLGGWVATRASGMKKSVYGNIEDIVLGAKIVTPIGTMEKSYNTPRNSNGPDVTQIVLGSEGTLGVITEVVVRLRSLPEARRYGSVVFPNFESGVLCLRELAKKRIFPASVRLMDNMQFQLGQVLKPGAHSIAEEYIDLAKKFYVTKIKGFEINKMVAATLLFEGNPEDIDIQEKRVYSIASKYGGMKGGEENGKRGYFLTWMIAYIRDFGFDYWLISESFETSVPWANVSTLCQNVKDAVAKKCKDCGVKYPPFVTCRVTQSYETGACIYFYFAFVYRDLANPLKVYMEIEDFARDEILKYGGSLSHHHGIGKLRKKWMPEVISGPGIEALKGIKKNLDPQNIFANGNLV